MFKIIQSLLTIKKAIKMKSYKTLLSGILSLLPTLLGFFGIPFPPEIAHAIEVLGVALIAWFAKDKDVTGGSVPQTAEAETRATKIY